MLFALSIKQYGKTQQCQICISAYHNTIKTKFIVDSYCNIIGRHCENRSLVLWGWTVHLL